MRFTEDQVRQALHHSDKDVRFAALQYFAKSFSKNPTIMLDVIDVVERHGPENAFAYSFPIYDLAQNAASIDWAVKWLQNHPFDIEDNLTNHISRLLCLTDPKLVLPLKSVILEAPGFDRRMVPWLERRIGLLSTPSHELWNRLEAICESGKGKMDANEIAYIEAEDIAEALARDVSQADRMMDLLSQDFDPAAETPMIWLEIFLVQMAGHMRYEPAISMLIKKLLVDGEILNQECGKSLTMIGTDAVVRAVREQYPQAPHYFRLYCSGIFGDIHSDLAVSAGLELLSLELDLDLRTWLATALVDQFSTEAIDAARNVFLEDHPDSCDLKSNLVVTCKLMHYEIPELQKWERELAEPRRAFAGRELPPPIFDDLDDDAETTPTSTSTRTGRNDPCPCGSGKKFKKCCLNKPKAR